MNRVSAVSVVSALLLASTVGCGDNVVEPESESESGPGQVYVEIATPATPGDVTSIHVAVTGADLVAPIGTDLTQEPDLSWDGAVLDIPPGTGRTVTAEGFDASANNTFEGITTNVQVFGGKLTDVSIVMKPKDSGPFEGVNTPPDFISVIHPDQTLSTEPVTFFATADDPDADTQLTYVWDVLSGGGSFSNTVQPNQAPGTAVSTVYTPMAGFTGFAVIQIAVTDGLATTSYTFPIAIGAG